VTVFMPAPKRYGSLTRMLDLLYPLIGSPFSAFYKSYIENIGEREVALRDMYVWVQPEKSSMSYWKADGVAYKTWSDAALHAMNETDAYTIYEITENDLISYFAKRGWVQ